MFYPVVRAYTAKSFYSDFSVTTQHGPAGESGSPRETKEFGPIDTGRHNENTPWKVLYEEGKRVKKRQ